MIIWGSKGKTRTIGTGHFFCPFCKARRMFKHEKASRYFTLYFIPLFETKKLGEYIECQTCFMTFKPEVLEMGEEIEQERQIQEKVIRFVETISNDLESGIPVQFMLHGLSEAGLSKEDSVKVLMAATQGKMKKCATCQLVYKGNMQFCSTCGSRLILFGV